MPESGFDIYGMRKVKMQLKRYEKSPQLRASLALTSKQSKHYGGEGGFEPTCACAQTDFESAPL